MSTKKAFSSEIEALSIVLNALDGLPDADQVWVLQTAASRLGVTAPVTGIPPQPGNVTETNGSPGTGVAMEPKEFMKSKAPSNDVQRVACLAYYLTHYRGTPHFKSRDLTSLNTEAAGLKINMSRAVNNATNQNHYLAAAGSGKKQITAHGEDVTNALPDQEAAKAIEEKGRPRRRKTGARNKKKM